MKVIAKGITYNRDGELREINVYVENNSPKNVTVGTSAIIINDYMISDLASIKVSAGTKANDRILISGTALREAGIDNIGKIEMYLKTYDPSSYDIIEESDCITIKTTEYDNIDTETSVTGSTILDEQGIKVIAQSIGADSFWGEGLLIYIENNSDKIIHAYADDTVVNGYSIDGVYASEVYPGKKDINSLTFFSSKLEENGIDKINTIDFSLRILDDKRNQIANTGKITVTAQ